MKKMLMCGMIGMSVCCGMTAQETAIYNDGFEGGEYSKYIGWSSTDTCKLNKGAAKDGKYCLELTKGKESCVVVRPVDVEPGIKYKLSFMAKIDGADTLESNPQLEHLFFKHDKKAAGRSLPSWRIAFLDAKSKDVGIGVAKFYNCMMSGEWTEYVDVFYVPAGTVKLKLIIGNGNSNNTLLVDNLKLEKVDEGALNINPEFKYGERNYSGYNYVFKAKVIETEAGKYALETADDAWGIGDAVPVKENTAYKLTYRLKNSAERKLSSGVGCWFLSKDKKKLGEPKTVAKVEPGQEKEVSYDFLTPAGTAYVQLIFGGSICKKVVLNEDKK